jgi:methionine-rich copper-binding protein CopC
VTRRKEWIYSALCALGLLLWLSLAYLPAYAHAGYERSEPGDGAIVARPPEHVAIWFTQELFRREGENWILVEDPEGGTAHAKAAEIDDDDRSLLSVPLVSPLIPGTYRVEWGSLSAEDGDTDEGEFSFTYDPQAVATSTPMLASTSIPTLTPTGVAAEATSSPNSIAPEEATPSPEAGSASNGGCGLGLLPALGLIALALGTPRRRNRNL